MPNKCVKSDLVTIDTAVRLAERTNLNSVQTPMVLSVPGIPSLRTEIPKPTTLSGKTLEYEYIPES